MAEASKILNVLDDVGFGDRRLLQALTLLALDVDDELTSCVMTSRE